MSKLHKVIIIPGLGDNGTRPIELATNHWRRHGLEPYIHLVGWRDGEKSFEPKLKRLLKLVDSFIKTGDRLSLVGTSAGGSAALNVFALRKNRVHRIVNVCGRLRVGPETGFRSFSNQSKTSSSFAESVRCSEKVQKSFSDNDKKRIMTVKAMFGDEFVPPETVTIEGAKNIEIPTIEHMLSISLSLTLFSRVIIDFLKE